MTHLIRGLVSTAAAIVSCVLVAACTPPAPAPPVARPVATRVAPTESEFQREERVAYEDAELAYRTFRTDYTRVVVSSYAPRLTPLMRKTAGGGYLRHYARQFKRQRERGLRSTAGVKVRLVQQLAYQPSKVLLVSCEDGQGDRQVTRSDRTVGRGSITRVEIEVRMIGNRWKVWDEGNKVTVDSCEA